MSESTFKELARILKKPVNTLSDKLVSSAVQELTFLMEDNKAANKRADISAAELVRRRAERSEESQKAAYYEKLYSRRIWECEKSVETAEKLSFKQKERADVAEEGLRTELLKVKELEERLAEVVSERDKLQLRIDKGWDKEVVLLKDEVGKWRKLYYQKVKHCNAVWKERQKLFARCEKLTPPETETKKTVPKKCPVGECVVGFVSLGLVKAKVRDPLTRQMMTGFKVCPHCGGKNK